MSVFYGGCGNPDFTKIRSDHARDFDSQISSKSSAELSVEDALDLASCVKIALANNLDIKTAEISSRLATLDRKIAFGNFLPHIDVGLNGRWDSKHQAIGKNGVYNNTGDQNVISGYVQASQSVLMPETWFLYSAYTHGEDISQILADRTAGVIRLQVTALYYNCLSLDAYRESLELSGKRAGALCDEVELRYREGLATLSDLESVKTLRLDSQLAIRNNHRQQIDARAALLEAMGLSPLAEIKLEKQCPFKIDNKNPEEYILDAMLNRVELKVADRTIEIRKDEIRMAIAGFLPKVNALGTFTSSGDSFLKYSNIFTLGVSGVMSVFEGFQNINNYKAAKQNSQQSFIDREQACLKIMLEVIGAYQQYDRAVDIQQLAEQNLRAAKLRNEQAQLQFTEGLVTNSDRLAAETDFATAERDVILAEFNYQLSAATLLDVTGESLEGQISEKE